MNDDTAPEPPDAVLTAATAASAPLAALRPARRAALLRAAADAPDAATGALVPRAMRESSLPEQRLTGEMAGTSGQLRLFAAALPQHLLPEALTDHHTLGLPRRVDGTLTTGDIA